MRGKKVTTICAILVLVSLLYGCSEKYTINDKIAKSVYKKYGFDVDITNVVNKAGTKFGDSAYVECIATIPDTGEQFDVYYIESNDTIEDNYAVVLFDEQIQEKMQAIIDNALDVEILDYRFNYYNEDNAWHNSSEINDFLDNTNSFFYAEIQVDGTDEKDLTNKLVTFKQSIEEQGLQYIIACNFKINDIQKTITIGNTKYIKNDADYDIVLLKINNEMKSLK